MPLLRSFLLPSHTRKKLQIFHSGLRKWGYGYSMKKLILLSLIMFGLTTASRAGISFGFGLPLPPLPSITIGPGSPYAPAPTYGPYGYPYGPSVVIGPSYYGYGYPYG